MDIAMPGPSSIALLDRLRSTCPDVPMLVYSWYEERVYAARMIEAGAAGYVE